MRATVRPTRAVQPPLAMRVRQIPAPPLPGGRSRDIHLDRHMSDRGTGLDTADQFLATPPSESGVTVHESLLGDVDWWNSHTISQRLTSPVDPRANNVHGHYT